MSKLTIAQAAAKFKVSKEAIHNRIRRGSLDCVIEHGVKHVVINDLPSIPEVKVNDDTKYYAYIEDENSSLKEKVKWLETKNSQLRDQKELMLLQEKKKIEQIYKERDLQLQQVLSTINTKFLQHQESQPVLDEEEEDGDVVDVIEVQSEPIRLKYFLKLKDYKSAKRLRIKNRFKRLLGADERIFRKEGKIFIDPARYNYKDLLS